MKNSSTGEPSPFSSSTHDPNLAKSDFQNQPVPAQGVPGSPSSNVPPSVQRIMAANAQGVGVGMPVISSCYKPSGKIGSLALPAMLISALVGGLLAAAVYYFVAPHFNFVLITQAYLGALLAVPLWLGVKVGKVRSLRYASIFALLGTLVLFVAFHSANVWREREQALDMYAPSVASAANISVSAARARLGQSMSYARATQLYWKERYVNGVQLQDRKAASSYSNPSAGTHLTGVFYIAFLLAEIGITALAAAVITSFPTSARFSETQDRWYSKKCVLRVGRAEIWSVLQCLHTGDWANARQVALGRKRKSDIIGHVFVSTVPNEPKGWVEMTITQDKQQKLLFEAEVDVTVLRALGAKIKA